MSAKHYIDADGNYLGGFIDGAEPPQGAIEIPEPPPHGLMKRQGGAWVDTPASTAAKNRISLVDLLQEKGILNAADIARLSN